MITLWLEGLSVDGKLGNTQCLGTYDTQSFERAVKLYMLENPGEVKWDWYGRGRHAIMGCEIFDDEKKAYNSMLIKANG